MAGMCCKTKASPKNFHTDRILTRHVKRPGRPEYVKDLCAYVHGIIQCTYLPHKHAGGILSSKMSTTVSVLVPKGVLYTQVPLYL